MITEFIRARIAEREAIAQAAKPGPTGQWSWVTVPELTSAETRHIAENDPARVLAECKAHRRIVELHESWPVLVERQPTFETIEGDDPTRLAFRATREIAWLTEQEYRTRFGAEPPTAPMIRVLASIWADHPDFDLAWMIA